MLCTYTEMVCIQTCCNHILSAAEGFRGQEQHARIHEFLSVFLVLSLFYNLQKGSNGFIAEKTILILYQGSRGGPLFSKGGGSTYFRGVQMLMSIETHITCYFPGGGSSGPTFPLWVRTWAMSSYNGTIFITVPLLTIIVRH